MAEKPRYITDVGDPYKLAKKGYLGPEVSPDVVFSQIRDMLASSRQAGAGYLSSAAGAAGGVPVGLAGRQAALMRGGEERAAAMAAASMSQYQAQKWENAMDRFLRLKGMEWQQEAQQGAAAAGLWGGIGSLLTMPFMFSATRSPASKAPTAAATGGTK